MITTENSVPVSFRVIGFSHQFEQTIEAVNSLGYGGMSAELYSDEKVLAPTAGDKMVILLGVSGSEKVRSLAKTFHDAEVLTLLILTRQEKISCDWIDAYTVVSPEKVIEVVKSLIEPIFMPCRINYAFNDLKFTLAKAKRFIVKKAVAAGDNRVSDAIGQLIGQTGSETLGKIDRLSIILSFDPNSDRPLSMTEISGLSAFLNNFVESVDVIWALYYDETLQNDALRISLICAGENLCLNSTF